MHIASLASVYHKPPSSFLPDYLHMPVKKVVYMEDMDEDEEGEDAEPGGLNNPLVSNFLHYPWLGQKLLWHLQ